MEMHAEAPKRWPLLEKRAVGWPLQVVALALAVVLALHWTGHLALTPRLRALSILGFLIAAVLGSRRFRDTLTVVQSTILLAIVYVLGCGIASLFMRLFGRDLLDTRKPKASLWRTRPRLTVDQLAENVSRQF